MKRLGNDTRANMGAAVRASSRGVVRWCSDSLARPKVGTSARGEGGKALISTRERRCASGPTPDGLQKPERDACHVSARVSQEVGTGTSAKSVAPSKRSWKELFNRAVHASRRHRLRDSRLRSITQNRVQQKRRRQNSRSAQRRSWVTCKLEVTFQSGRLVAAGTVGFGGGHQTLNVGERFGIEGGDHHG